MLYRPQLHQRRLLVVRVKTRYRQPPSEPPIAGALRMSTACWSASGASFTAMNASNVGVLLRSSMSQCRPTDHAELTSYINYDEFGPHFFHFDHAVPCLLNAPTWHFGTYWFIVSIPISSFTQFVPTALRLIFWCGAKLGAPLRAIGMFPWQPLTLIVSVPQAEGG
jgi:hypothetical protein